MKSRSIMALLTALLLVGAAQAATAPEIQTLQKRWAEVLYKTPEKQREEAFESLALDAHKVVEQHPDSAEGHIWEGIILSTYAGESGGLGALKLVKQARSTLEAALAIDAEALNGSAYTSLGALYYQVPGWPVSFGSDKKAREYLEKGLRLNPEGIDSNFFYGSFLIEEGDYEAAEAMLLKALEAPPRDGREVADAGRRQEIEAKLAVIKEKRG